MKSLRFGTGYDGSLRYQTLDGEDRVAFIETCEYDGGETIVGKYVLDEMEAEAIARALLDDMEGDRSITDLDVLLGPDGRYFSCPECSRGLPVDGVTECDQCGAHLELLVETVVPPVGGSDA